MKRLILFIISLIPVSTFAVKWVDMGQRTQSGKKVYWASSDFTIKNGEFGFAEYGGLGTLFGWGDVTGEAVGNRLMDYGGEFPPQNASGNPEYDLITAKMGTPYRIPSYTELQWLIDNCDFKEVTLTVNNTSSAKLPLWLMGQWMWHRAQMTSLGVENVSWTLQLDEKTFSIVTSNGKYTEGVFYCNNDKLNVNGVELTIDYSNKRLLTEAGEPLKKISNKPSTITVTGMRATSRVNGNSLFFPFPKERDLESSGDCYVEVRSPQIYGCWSGDLFPNVYERAIIFLIKQYEGYGLIGELRIKKYYIRAVKEQY